jgi:hypothetical protein
MLFSLGADSDRRPAAPAGTDHQQTAAVGMHGRSRVSKDRTKQSSGFHDAMLLWAHFPLLFNCCGSIRGVGWWCDCVPLLSEGALMEMVNLLPAKSEHTW